MKLQRVSRCSPAVRSPAALLVEGAMSHDRQAWLEEAYEFGRRRFGSTSNSEYVQNSRLNLLGAVARDHVFDGRFAPVLGFFDVLQGRASMKSLTAPGGDSTPPKVLRKRIPFALVRQIWKLFQTRYANCQSEEPPFWKILEYVGIPKTRSANILDDFRWISKQSCM